MERRHYDKKQEMQLRRKKEMYFLLFIRLFGRINHFFRALSIAKGYFKKQPIKQLTKGAYDGNKDKAMAFPSQKFPKNEKNEKREALQKRLNGIFESGEYYEGKKMLRTVYSQYFSKKDYAACEELLSSAANALLNAKQFDDGSHAPLSLSRTVPFP